LLEQAEAVGEATGALARELLGRFTLGHLREVMALLRLRERYDDARLERACRRARVSGDGRYRTVQRILERGLDALEVDDDPPVLVARVEQHHDRADVPRDEAVSRLILDGRGVPIHDPPPSWSSPSWSS